MGLLSGGSGEESACKFIQVIGRIQLLVVVGLRSLSFLLAVSRDCSQLLVQVLDCGPFSFQQQRTFLLSNLSYASHLSAFSAATSKRKLPALKRFRYQCRPIQIISLLINLKSLTTFAKSLVHVI